MSIWQGLCSYNNQLFAAWKGEPQDDRLFYTHFDGATWARAVMIDGDSSVGPALAVWGFSMFAAWKGEHGDERLFFTGLTVDSWSAQAVIPGFASSAGPSMCEFGGKLYAAWKGAGSNQAVWYSSFDGSNWSPQAVWYSSFDGSNWSPQAVIPGVASSVGPSLCEFGGKLFAAWKGSANNQAVWYSSFDGSNWSPQAVIPSATSSVGPSLCEFGGKLYAAWKRETGNEQLWYSSFDGSNWSPQAVIPGVGSSIGPCLCEFGGRLYAMWKGKNDDVRLWYASFDGSNWSAQANVPGNSGQDLPQNIGLRMQYQETSQWCWIAVATSINHYYNSASTATQCALMTTIGRAINGWPATTQCCPTAAVLASNPGLVSILAAPYSQPAEAVLDSPAYGLPQVCIKSGGVTDALKVRGNLNTTSPSLTLTTIADEIAAGRPIAVDVQWKSGAAHCVAIVGVLNDWLLICDPIFGESVIQYEDFPAAYQTGATLVQACLTQSGS